MERRFYDDHDRKFSGSTRLVVASFNKMLHDDYLCLVESGKQQIKKSEKNSTGKLGNKGNS